jgi:Fur family transcriptional regulator, ferric uptake regulator
MTDPFVAFRDFLRRNEYKLTPQRELILDTLLQMEGHPAPEELYHEVKKRDPSIGQATVYRTLKLLSQAGMAKELHFGDGLTRYEHKYGQTHHDHLICERCGANIEVVDETIERLQEELADKHGFRLTGHRMYLYGVCGECRNKG